MPTFVRMMKHAFRWLRPQPTLVRSRKHECLVGCITSVEPPEDFRGDETNYSRKYSYISHQCFFPSGFADGGRYIFYERPWNEQFPNGARYVTAGRAKVGRGELTWSLNLPWSKLKRMAGVNRDAVLLIEEQLRLQIQDGLRAGTIQGEFARLSLSEFRLDISLRFLRRVQVHKRVPIGYSTISGTSCIDGWGGSYSHDAGALLGTFEGDRWTFRRAIASRTAKHIPRCVARMILIVSGPLLYQYVDFVIQSTPAQVACQHGPLDQTAFVRLKDPGKLRAGDGHRHAFSRFRQRDCWKLLALNVASWMPSPQNPRIGHSELPS
jgi:hypothetical protein